MVPTVNFSLTGRTSGPLCPQASCLELKGVSKVQAVSTTTRTKNFPCLADNTPLCETIGLIASPFCLSPFLRGGRSREPALEADRFVKRRPMDVEASAENFKIKAAVLRKVFLTRRWTGLIPRCSQWVIYPPHPNPLPPRAGGEGTKDESCHLIANRYKWAGLRSVPAFFSRTSRLMGL